MNNKLIPCPFCGSNMTGKGIITHNKDCFVNKLIYMHPVEELEKAWNTRAEDPVKAELLDALKALTEEVSKYCYHPDIEHMGPYVLDAKAAITIATGGE